MRVLAVIPARGGSKGIPRKNVRLMDNKPLIYYVINHAMQCKMITDIVVTTDDEEIAYIAKAYGVLLIEREPALAEDWVTLDPVVHDAVVRMEEKHRCTYDVVVTLQPTSPMLRIETLTAAFDALISGDADTVISAINEPHLSWGKDERGYYPQYKERLNRQQLPPNLIECGAFVISRRRFVQPDSRIGGKVAVCEIPRLEAIDIDSVGDWILCENILKRKRIVFRVDGNRLMGMGHIYRCLTLAYAMIEHDVMLVTRTDMIEGLDKIKASFMPYIAIENDAGFFRFLNEYKPDIIVNDCLNTTYAYISQLKALAGRVVTFEDLGSGTDAADAVVNALYENTDHRPHIFSGEKYICLRDEYIITEPISVCDKVCHALSIFGGTDPANLTEKVYRLACEETKEHPDLKFTFIVGLSYDFELHGVLPRENIQVVRDVKRVSAYMAQTDLAFTSQGRTVFELASMGVPSIVMAQNEREPLHTFAQMENGFLNLGLGCRVDDETLKQTFEWLAATPGIRREMHRLMRKYDLRSALPRVKRIILGE